MYKLFLWLWAGLRLLEEVPKVKMTHGEGTACGAAWVQSKAKQSVMFLGSPGFIWVTVCSTAVKQAVHACLQASRVGKCDKGANGPIAEWDVSDATVMSKMFKGATLFNGALSKWFFFEMSPPNFRRLG